MIYQNFNEYVTCAYDGKGGKRYVRRAPESRHHCSPCGFRISTRSRRNRHHEIAPVRAGHLHRRSSETRAAPGPRVGEKRPPWGRAGRCPGLPPGGTFGWLAALGGRHRGLQDRGRHGSMSTFGTFVTLRIFPLMSGEAERLIGPAALAAVIPAKAGTSVSRGMRSPLSRG